MVSRVRLGVGGGLAGESGGLSSCPVRNVSGLAADRPVVVDGALVGRGRTVRAPRQDRRNAGIDQLKAVEECGNSGLGARRERDHRSDAATAPAASSGLKSALGCEIARQLPDGSASSSADTMPRGFSSSSTICFLLSRNRLNCQSSIIGSVVLTEVRSVETRKFIGVSLVVAGQAEKPAKSSR